MAHTGGTITTPGDGYTYHTFTSSGTFTPDGSVSVEYLVVAGGGGGGFNLGGGGGAGQALTGSTSLSSPTTVTIGAGGTGGNYPSTLPTAGSNSVMGAVTANGGGRGGSRNDSSDGSGNGGAGGNGGGGGGESSSDPSLGGTGNQFNGGNGFKSSTGTAAGGGGGGAGGAGGNASSSTGGARGAAIEWPASSGNFYAQGGEGGDLGASGIGGGAGSGKNGAANTGGGGAGARSTGDIIGGNGGSGIVIIRYAVSSDVSGTIAVTEEDDTSTLTGTVTSPPSGTIAVTEEDDTLIASGYSVEIDPVSGAIAVTEEDDTLAMLGAAIYDVTGDIIVTEEDDTFAGAAAMAVFGTINFSEEDDYVDANEDFFGIVTTNVVDRLTEANRRSRLQIPKLPEIVDPAAKRYLDTTFRYIQDEFNRLTGFHFKAIDLMADQIQAQQDLITSIIPLIPVNPSVPPPTSPPWNPNPTNPTTDGTYWYFDITLCADDVTEWELQRQNLVTPTWTTILAGTTTTSPIAILATNFSEDYAYRVRWRCPGDDWTNGDPFTINDGTCAAPTDINDMSDFANLVAYIPKVCPPTTIYEAISDTPGQIGPAYGGWLVSTATHYALSQPDRGGLVAHGLAPAANNPNPPLRVQMKVYPNTSDFTRFSVGAIGVGFNLSNEDMVPAASIKTTTGTQVMQVESPTDPDTEYLLEAYYSVSEEKLVLKLDDVEIGNISVAAATVAHQDIAAWSLVIPEGSWATDCAAWDSVIVEPPDFNDLWFNFDASVAGVLTLSGSDVTAFASNSGSYTGSLVDPGTNGRPSTGRTINGRAALNFVAADQEGLRVVIPGLTGTDLTVMAVVQFDILGGNVVGADWQNSRNFQFRPNGTDFEVIGFQSSVSAVADTAGATLSTGVPYLLTLIRNGTTLEARVNNVGNGSTACNQQNAGIILSMGADAGGVPVWTSFFDGAYGHLRAYKRKLTEDELAAEAAYMMNRWGIS